MRIVGLTLDCADVGAQEDFYGGTLGLEVARVGDGVVEVRLRDSTIRFRPAAAGAAPRYHFAINVPRGSIGRAAAWVAERHELLAFHGDPDEEEGATIVHTARGTPAVYFPDPAGNVVELIANVRLEDRGDGLGSAFGPGDLLEVAEIGIAAADPGATCAAVEEFFGQAVLWGGAPGWQLTALGDDHAVVIVAPLGRGWIPVALPARPAPTEIVAIGAEAGETILAEGPYVMRRVTAVAGADRD
jgi:catechol 2,3-dioxygenase-like lactoylglutathione lyase family enzyme